MLLLKGNIHVHLPERWYKAFDFVQNMKMQTCNKKQKDKAKTLFLMMKANYTKARIFYWADIFAHIKQLNKT